MRYVENLFRHWVRFVILLVVLPLAIAAGSVFLIRSYSATAALWIEDPSNVGISTAAAGWNQYLTPAQNQRDSLLQLLKTQSFLGQLGDQLLQSGTVSGPIESGRVLATVPTRLNVVASGSQLLTLSFTCDKPAVCLKVIGGVIDLYRQWLAQVDRNQATLAGTFFSGQLADAQKKLQTSQNALQQYLNSHPGTTLSAAPYIPQLDSLTRQVDLDHQSVDTLQQRVYQLQFTGAETNQLVDALSNVIDPPAMVSGRMAAIKTSLKRALPAVAACIAAGLAYLVLLTGLDRAARDPQELERRLKVPVLVTIPEFVGMGKA